MNPLYKWAASLMVILTLVGLIYGKGRMDTAHAAELRELRLELSTVREAANRERNARLKDVVLARESQDRIEGLNGKIEALDAYVSSLEDRDHVCLSGPDTDRLRNLWD